MVTMSGGQKVSVLGAGNGGYTLAFDLAHRGFQVALFEHPDFKQAIEPVQKTGQIVAVEEADGFKVGAHQIFKLFTAKPTEPCRHMCKIWK